MIQRVTNKHVNELINLINEYGYWSDQVKEYNSKFTFYSMMKLQEKVKKRLNDELISYK